MRFLLRILIIAVAAFGALHLLPGAAIEGSWRTVALTVVAIGAVDAIIRPLVVRAPGPPLFAMLLIATALINVALFAVVAHAHPLGVVLRFSAFERLFGAALLVSAVSATSCLFFTPVVEPRW